MKKIGVLAVVMAMAFLFVGVASAEMYVEGYIGGAFAQHLGLTVVRHRQLASVPVSGIDRHEVWNTDSHGAGRRQARHLVRPRRLPGVQLSRLDEVLRLLHRFQLPDICRRQRSAARCGLTLPQPCYLGTLGDTQERRHGGHLGLHVCRPLRLLPGFRSALRPPAALCGGGPGHHVLQPESKNFCSGR